MAIPRGGLIFSSFCVDRWKIGDSEVRLIRNENKLRYRVISLANGHFYEDAIEIRDAPADTQRVISFLSKCTVRLSDVGAVSFGPPFIQREPTAVSRFDDSVVIDKDNWAITLVSTGMDWHGHAVIAIEGIDRYTYSFDGRSIKELRFFSEGRHIIKSKLKSHNLVEQVATIAHKNLDGAKIFGKTQTWLRRRDLVKTMIDRIEWEMSESSHSPIYFNIFGSDSMQVKPLLLSSASLLLNKIRFFDILRTPSQPEPLEFEAATRVLDEGNEREFIVYTNRSRSYFIRYKKDVRKFGHIIVEEHVYPDNCITWARKKISLAMIDLPLSEKGYLVTTPLEYTNSGQESLRVPFYDCGCISLSARCRPFELARLKTPFCELRCHEDRVRVSGRSPLFGNESWVEAGAVHTLDLTEEVGQQIGPYPWKLTADTIDFLKRERSLVSLGCVGDIYADVNENRLTISVLVNQTIQQIDLTHAVKKQLKAFRQKRSIEAIERLRRERAQEPAVEFATKVYLTTNRIYQGVKAVEDTMQIVQTARANGASCVIL